MNSYILQQPMVLTRKDWAFTFKTKKPKLYLLVKAGKETQSNNLRHILPEGLLPLVPTRNGGMTTLPA